MSSFSQKIAIFSGIIAFIATGAVVHAAEFSSPEVPQAVPILEDGLLTIRPHFSLTEDAAKCVGSFEIQFTNGTVHESLRSDACTNVSGAGSVSSYPPFQLFRYCDDWKAQTKTVDVVVREARVSMEFKDGNGRPVASSEGQHYRDTGFGKATFHF